MLSHNMKFTIIISRDRNGGIGKDNELACRLAGDLKHFSKVTRGVTVSDMKNAVIMGRRTWESLPENKRPLAGRVNVVLTRQEDYEVPDGVRVYSDLDEAL